MLPRFLSGKTQILHVPKLTAPGSQAPWDRESLDLVGPVPLPVAVADQSWEASWYVAAPAARPRPPAVVSVAVFGDPFSQDRLPLVRVHSACLTGDIFGSLRCDCGPQLERALEELAASKSGGMLVYMLAHEGRGIGLWAKAAAYLLQDEGLDTYKANRNLGFDDDNRDYRYAAAVLLHFFGTRSFQLLTNNLDKVNQLRARGLTGVVQRNHVAGVAHHNHRYLLAKRRHDHTIPRAALELVASSK